MKKIIFSITIVLFSLSVVAQQEPSSDVISGSMPTGAKKLTKDELSTYVHANYKRSQIFENDKNIYRIDGLLISFWDLSVNPQFKKTLQASQAEILGLLKRNDKNVINFSKIIKVNDIQFLVYEYQKDDEVFLRFQSDFDKNNRNICGIVQCKEPDKDKADKALNDFLQTVHFKNQ